MLFALALLACSTPEPAPAPVPEPVAAPAPAPEPAAPTTPDWDIKSHMDARFAFATDALWLTFGGNIDGVKAEAAKLASIDVDPATPEAIKPYLDTVHARSLALADADSIDAAAKGLVEIAAACAECHTANDGPVLNEEDMKIAPMFFEESTMDRHQWAVYMMWIGLVAPNDTIWVNGTKAFAHPMGAMPKIPEGAKDLELRVHDLAARGTAAKTPEEKGAVFADLITTCAACHTKAGVSLGQTH